MILTKKRQIFIVLVAALLLASCSSTRDVKYYDNKGNSVQLSTLKGKWVIVNYWAPWCAACRYEVPELNLFYKNNQDKNVVIYGVDAERSDADAQDDAIATADIHFPVLRQDPGNDWQLSAVDMIPMTFIIDPNGKLVKTIVGVNTEKSLKQTLHKLKTEVN